MVQACLIFLDVGQLLLFGHATLELTLSTYSKERINLLRQWVMRNENASQCEASIVLQKTHASSYEKDRELLKVSQMVERGFSEQPSCVQ